VKLLAQADSVRLNGSKHYALPVDSLGHHKHLFESITEVIEVFREHGPLTSKVITVIHVDNFSWVNILHIHIFAFLKPSLEEVNRYNTEYRVNQKHEHQQIEDLRSA
jgi:hypothetical protein